MRTQIVCVSCPNIYNGNVFLRDNSGFTIISWFSTFLMVMYDFVLLDVVTYTRDVTLMLPATVHGIAMDVTRNDASEFSYPTLERLKNGHLVSGNNETHKMQFKPVPVVKPLLSLRYMFFPYCTMYIPIESTKIKCIEHVNSV